MQQVKLYKKDAASMTDCREQSWLFQDLGSRKVEVDFGAQQRGVESQHRSLEVFRNVKTLDPNAAEMLPQCAHLPPSDGSSTDDYCCRHNDRERHDSESEAQGQLHAG